MNEKAKQIVILFVGAAVIGGVITIQVRRSRPAPPIVTASPSEQVVAPAAPALPPPPRPEVSFAAPQDSTSPLPGTIEAETGAPPLSTELPPGQWGRDPFLTISEIAALQPQPAPQDSQVASEEPVLVLPPPEPVRELPAYTVSVIMSGERGSWAVVDSRIVRPGDRLGLETVQQITDRGIVLELDGKTREVLLQRPGLSAPSTPEGD